MVYLIKALSADPTEDDVIIHIMLNENTTKADEVLQNDDSFFIYSIIKGIKEELSFIRLENEVFTYFLQKNNAQSLLQVMKKEKSTKSTFNPRDKNVSFMSTRSSLGSKFSILSQRDVVASSISSHGSEKILNCEVKNEIAEKQLQDVVQRAKLIEENGRKSLRALRANIVALKIDLVDLEEASRNFDSMAEGGGEAETNILMKSKVSTERFMNYCSNWSNNAQEFINTIRLRTASIHAKSLQQKASNARKRDLKGFLMPVDFEKVKIARDKNESEIEEQTINLQGIKNLYSKVAFDLAMEKRSLIQAERTVQEMDRAIDFSRNQLKKVKREIDLVEEETRKSSEQLLELTKQMEDYVAPSIEDYFELKLKLAMIEKEEKQLERHNYILGMKLQNYKIKLAKQRRLETQ